MAYGIVVKNNTGGTIFDSTHPLEFGVATGTVTANVTTAAGYYSVPDYCYGHNGYDYSGSNVGTIQEDSSHSYPSGALNRLYFVQQTTTANKYTYLNIGNAYYGTSGDYYVDFTTDMTSFRNTGRSFARNNLNTTTHTIPGVGTITTSKTHISEFTIYARPVSSSYSGSFRIVLEQHVGYGFYDDISGITGKFPAVTANRKFGWTVAVRDHNNTNATFEIMIVNNSGEDYTSINTGSNNNVTSHHTAGTGSHGIQTFTDEDQTFGFRSGSANEQAMILFDSRSLPSQVIIAKDVQPTIDHSLSPQAHTIGSLSSSTTKRWCRMDSTSLWATNRVIVNNSFTREWNMHYKWTNNNTVSLEWRHHDLTTTWSPFKRVNSFLSKHPFTVVEFGEGI